MKNIRKTAAGLVAGAAIATAPLVAFAAPAFAATDAAAPASAASHQQHEQHVLVDHAWSGAQRDASSANSAHCGGGINC
jgi:hypothetical protein